MGSDLLARRTLLAGGAAAVVAVMKPSLPTLAHDGEEHGATPAVGTPAANDRHTNDGDSGVGVLYLTITNAGAEPDALLGGETTVCQAVEPHASRTRCGWMAR